MSTIRALSGALASRAVLRVAGADAANALQVRLMSRDSRAWFFVSPL